MRIITFLFFLFVAFIHFSCKKNADTISTGWSKIYGGSGTEISYSIASTTDGGAIAVGSTSSIDGDITANHCGGASNNNCGTDAWAIKLDGAGKKIWQHAYGGAPVDTRRGQYTYNFDQANSIIATADNNYIIAGQTNSFNGDVKTLNGLNSANFYNPTDVWVIKVKENGDTLWTRTLGGNANDTANCIIQTTDGYVIAGQTTSSELTGYHSGTDVYIIKINLTGTRVWQVVYGGAGEEKANAIVQADDGGFIVAGQTTSNNGNVSGNHGATDAWVFKITSAGQMVTGWNKVFGGEGAEMANCILKASDGGFLVVGQTNSTDGDVVGNHWTNYDAWVIKINDAGKMEWQKTLGGAFGDDLAKSAAITKDGGYVLAGVTNSSDGDVSGNHGYADAWVVKIDVKGKLAWQRTFGGSNFDGATCVVTANGGGLFVAGYTFSNDGDISEYLGYGNYWVVKINNE